MKISEETLDLIEDNIHAGDINLQRVRIAINDEGTGANAKSLHDHLLCSIAHLQSAADYLDVIARNSE